MSSLDSFFGSIKLPSMSEVAHELIRSMNSESISARQVGDIIAKDPALTIEKAHALAVKNNPELRAQSRTEKRR